MGTVPVGSEMVQTLSHMYTETLGEWSRYLFLIGAVAVLYSTVFAVTAANSRLFADWYGMIGGYDRRDFGSRTKYIRIFVVLLLLFPVVTFFYMREPVVMVKVSGIAQALMLPVIGFSAVYLRYRKLPGELAPKGWITLALWGTSGVMLVVAGYSILRAVAG
jgi:Mn2+/Fe2+ NRAMP family transporter